MKLRALIADDEQLARERLRLLLAGDQDIEIAGECCNGRQVVTALRNAPADVLFLDIQMPGQSGFEALEQLGSEAVPAVIFVTAHTRYAVQAFGVQALDYLTKPVDVERLRGTMARVRAHVAANLALATQTQLGSLQHPRQSCMERPSRLLVPNGSRAFFVEVADIDWIEAADYYCCLHVGSRSLMLRETIKQMTTLLDPAQFVRIHRSVIVNTERVSEVFHASCAEGAVVLRSGVKLRMSRRGWQALLASHSLTR